MWPNPQETTDLVTFTKETLTENFIFLQWFWSLFTFPKRVFFFVVIQKEYNYELH